MIYLPSVSSNPLSFTGGSDPKEVGLDIFVSPTHEARELAAKGQWV